MNTVLLTGNSFSRIPAGVEHFSDLLQTVFPKLTILSFDTLDEKSVPFFSEPFKAKRVCEHLNNQLDALAPETVLFNGMYGWPLARKTSFRKVGICHGTFASFAQNAMPWGLDRIRTQFLYSLFERTSFSRADTIVSNSTFTENILQKDYGFASQAIPFAIDFSVFKSQSAQKTRQKIGLSSEKPIVLFVGRPDYSKGFDIVQQMARQNPAWNFVSVTFPKANAPGIDCRGPLTPAVLSNYYAAADVVFFPSRFESFGFVTLEALACKRPVVTTSFGIASSLQHPACICPKDNSIQAFQSAIQTALRTDFAFDYPLENEFGIETFKKRFTQAIEQFANQTK